MPGAAWRGTISFGLVTIPVSLSRATETAEVAFRLLCGACHTPIQNRRWCPREERTVEWGEVVRGFEVDKGEYVPLSDQDLERLPLPSAQTIEILEVVPDAEIDGTVYLDQAYYVEPRGAAALRPYLLLQAVLGRGQRSAVGKLAMRTREHLCRIRAGQAGLLLDTLHWAHEVREAPEVKAPASAAALSRRELELAKALLDNLSGSFDPGRYHDDYREALLKVVAAKRGRRRLPKLERPAGDDNVIDLMAALKQAVEETKPGRSSGPRRASAAAPGGRPAPAPATAERRGRRAS